MLALYFTDRRRMALPSILLLLGFVGGVAGALAGTVEAIWPNIGGTAGALAASGVGLASAVAAWLHWRRFMVRSRSRRAAALVVVAIGLLVAAFPDIKHGVWPILLLCGVAVFALAMRWDMSDPRRETRPRRRGVLAASCRRPDDRASHIPVLGVFQQRDRGRGRG